jgi:hypothetical protein
MNPDAEGATPVFPEERRDTRDIESVIPPWVTVPVLLKYMQASGSHDVPRGVFPV